MELDGRWTVLVVPDIRLVRKMPLHTFQTIYQPKKLPEKERQGRRSLGGSISVPGDALLRCELSSEDVPLLRSIYEAFPLTWQYRFIMNRHNCLIELGLMASKAEKDQGKRPRPTLVRLTRQRPRVLAPGSSKDLRQKKRTLSVNPSGEVVLESPHQAAQNPGGSAGGPYDSRKKLRELIGAPGTRIPNDALRNVPFYPSVGAQAVKKYFTSRWKEFTSHEDLEDVLEAAFGIQLKKVAAKALEVANKEKKRLLGKAESHEQETQSLRESLEATGKREE
ncbi:hypothetical protein Adt_27855 [Abeliophyllum distichum]|uniref:Uncharacterized protein n=1 Tax=Abeliophyllum distichum TaxID=126358 RepID=A0ABD1RUY8_9LAMI